MMSKESSWFGSDYIPYEYLEIFADTVLNSCLNDIRKQKNLSVSERKWVKKEIKIIVSNFDEIRRMRRSPVKEAGLRAIISSLNLGYYHVGGPKRLQEIKRNINKERVAPANKANEKPDVNKIVMEEAQKCRLPSERAVAGHIVPKVLKRLAALPVPPSDWPLNKELGPDEQDTVGERIRGIIRRQKVKAGKVN